MSDSLSPHGLHHARLPCPSPTPGVCSNSCPSSWWYHPTISSSVIPFSSCLQSFQASQSFLMSRLFATGGQCIRASASSSVLPKNIQHWYLLGLTGFISLQSKGFSRVFSSTTVWKHQSFIQPSLFSLCVKSCRPHHMGLPLQFGPTANICTILPKSFLWSPEPALPGTHGKVESWRSQEKPSSSV